MSTTSGVFDAPNGTKLRLADSSEQNGLGASEHDTDKIVLRLSTSIGSSAVSMKELAALEDQRESSHWLLGNRWFSGLVNAAIVASAIQMGVGHETLDRDVHHWLTLLESFFTAIFSVEMVLKLSVLKLNYFLDVESRGWNAMDFSICWISIVDCWVLPQVLAGGSSSALSIIRIFRLLRLLRLLKMLRHVPELMMVIEGMFAALRSMIWIVLLLSGLMFILGIVCVEIIGFAGPDLYPAYSTDTEDFAEDVVNSWNNYLYFGTLSRSLVSLFSMMLLSEWSPLIRPVFEQQPLMILPFAGLIFVTTFGIFNVMIGVVVERTNEAMAKEKRHCEREVAEKQIRRVRELADLMFQLDEDGDGKISMAEMYGMSRFNMCRFQDVLSSIDLPHGFGFQALFHMFDEDGTGELSQEEFVVGMLRLLDGNPFKHACVQQLAIAQLNCQLAEHSRQLREDIGHVSEDIAALRAEVTTILVTMFEGRASGDENHDPPVFIARAGGAAAQHDVQKNQLRNRPSGQSLSPGRSGAPVRSRRHRISVHSSGGPSPGRAVGTTSVPGLPLPGKVAAELSLRLPYQHSGLPPDIQPAPVDGLFVGNDFADVADSSAENSFNRRCALRAAGSKSPSQELSSPTSSAARYS